MTIVNMGVELPVFDPETEVRISHSQAAAYDTCPKYYELCHIDRLMPKSKSPAVQRGLTGHVVLDHWAKGLLAGKSSEESYAEGFKKGIEFDANYAMKDQALIHNWITKIFPTLGWTILAAEQKYMIQVGVTADGKKLMFPVTIDLIVRDTWGNILVVDHKFTQDAYEQYYLMLMPQLKKYVAVLRALKINAKHGYYNIFRTRDNMKDLTERSVQQPDKFSDTQLINAFTNQVENMKLIAAHEGPYKRNLGYACNRCSMKPICSAEEAGMDSTLTRQVDYVESDYGYSHPK